MGDYPSMSSKWEIHNYKTFLLKWAPSQFSLKHIPKLSKRADYFAKTALWFLSNL